MRNGLLGLVALALATLAVFALWPQIDLDAARLFYGNTGFIGRDPFERAIRAFFNITPFLVLAAFASAYAMRRAGIAIRYAPNRAPARLSRRDHGGRTGPHRQSRPERQRPSSATLPDAGIWRPVRIPPLVSVRRRVPTQLLLRLGRGVGSVLDGRAGESAPLPEQPFVIAGAVLFGVLASLLRMAFGGHYLSDVILAALVMLMIIQGARMLLFSERDPT